MTAEHRLHRIARAERVMQLLLQATQARHAQATSEHAKLSESERAALESLNTINPSIARERARLLSSQSALTEILMNQLQDESRERQRRAKLVERHFERAKTAKQVTDRQLQTTYSSTSGRGKFGNIE